MFAESNGTHRTTLERYIELERALLEQYQKYLADQLAVHDAHPAELHEADDVLLDDRHS